MIRSFHQMNASADQNDFSAAMSQLRISVKWGSKCLKKQWSRNDFDRDLKVRTVPVEPLYCTPALLLNFKLH